MTTEEPLEVMYAQIGADGPVLTTAVPVDPIIAYAATALSPAFEHVPDDQQWHDIRVRMDGVDYFGVARRCGADCYLREISFQRLGSAS